MIYWLFHPALYQLDVSRIREGNCGFSGEKLRKKHSMHLMSLRTTSQTTQTISGIKLSFPVGIDVFCLTCEPLFFRVGERHMYISYKPFLEIPIRGYHVYVYTKSQRHPTYAHALKLLKCGLLLDNSQ